MFVPFLLLSSVALVLVMLTLAIVARRLVRGEERGRTIAWFALAAVPVVLFSISFVYAERRWSQRQVPTGIRGRFVMMVAGSLMEAQAACFYPKRMESDRLIMFYYDLADPVRDIQAMDLHVSQIERVLGRPVRSKIHWVRGSLLGRSYLSFFGLALGSTQSPTDWSTAGTVDRHELAHAVLTQLRNPSCEPPMLLHEGWAEAQSGMDSVTLAVRALDAKTENPTIELADLLGPDRYGLDAGVAYAYGGAFVDFLLREFSAAQFVDIYNRCHVNTSNADFRAVYGMSVSDLEDAFWRDAEAIAGN